MEATDLFTPGRKKARIEIIPLIDVVFFLLATFVLFILSLDKIGSLPAHLPAARPDPKTEDSTVYIQASESGTLYWKQGQAATPEVITSAEIPPRLAEYTRRVAVPRVFIRGDSKAKFGTAVQVFDQVRAAGIKQVSVETVTSPTGK